MVATVLSCPHCQSELKTSQDKLIGKKIRCRKCGDSFRVSPQQILRQTMTAIPVAVGVSANAGKTPNPDESIETELAVPEVTAIREKTPSYVAKSGPQVGELVAAPFSPPPNASGEAKSFSVVALAVAAVLCLFVVATAGLLTLIAVSTTPEKEPVAKIETVAPKVTPKIEEPEEKKNSPPEVLPPKTNAGEKVNKKENTNSSPKQAEPKEEPDNKTPVELNPNYEVPVTPVEVPTLSPHQQKINETIDGGVAFLRKTQKPEGRWHFGGHQVGYAALPALTLLECGVKGDDPQIQKAAHFVRANVPSLTSTYDLSLAIMFLDRLGEKQDGNLIRGMALRLIAGQNQCGGWSYNCPILTDREEYELMYFLAKTDPTSKLILTKNKKDDTKLLDKNTPLPTPIENPERDLHKAIEKDNPRQQGLLDGRPTEKGGKSGIVMPSFDEQKKEEGKKLPQTALKRPELKANFPVNKLQQKVARLPIVNYRTSLHQKPSDLRLVGSRGDNSNTQFAMMALWAARRHKVPMARTIALFEHRFRTTMNRDGGWSYIPLGGRQSIGRSTPAMTCVGLIGLAMGHGSYKEMMDAVNGPQKDMIQADPDIQMAMAKLSQHVQQAPDDFNVPVPMDNLYYLWSMERVAVLYDLKTIGDKDWYRWVSQMLVTNQRNDGAWMGGGYHGSNETVDTCLALLILKRANLVQDLTNSLRMYIPIMDPSNNPNRKKE